MPPRSSNAHASVSSLPCRGPRDDPYERRTGPPCRAERVERRAFATVCATVLLVQGVIFASTGAPERDQAEQLVLAQAFALAYPGMQPPLYTWAVRLLTAGAGLAPLAALALLKGAALLALLAGVRALARELGLGPRRRLLAIALLALMPKFLWEAQRDMTHSVVAAAAVAWMLACLLRSGATDPPDGMRGDAPGAALPVGAVCAAVALLSKYNAALPVVVAGLLLVPRRHGPGAGRLAACAAMTFALVAPHAIALALHARAVDEIEARVTGAPAGATDRATILARESLAFAGALAAAVGAGWLALPGAHGRLARRRRARAPESPPADGNTDRNAGESADLPAATAVARRRARHRFLLHHLALTAGLASTAMVLGGTPDFRDRWLMPLLVALPVLCARRIPARAIPPTLMLCGTLLAASEALLVARHAPGSPIAARSAKPWIAMLAPAVSATLQLSGPAPATAPPALPWAASNRVAAAWLIARPGAGVRVDDFDAWLAHGDGPYLWSDEEATLRARLGAAGCRFTTIGRPYGPGGTRWTTTLHAIDRAAADACAGRLPRGGGQRPLPRHAAATGPD